MTTAKQLEDAATKAAASLARRNQVIRYARSSGMTLREIAKHTGMSHEQVRRICA